MNNFGALLGKLIASPVGNNLENEEGDVRRVKGIFSNLGYYNRTVENGIIDRELDTAIQAFQKDKKLKIDGYMNPQGETESALIKLMIEKQVEESTGKYTSTLEASGTKRGRRED
jgi:peptidoglycan hydrolase-like protein with peptidoglycan-binding domain